MAGYKFYPDMCASIGQNPSTFEVNIIFDFNEKILLPSTQLQPGQLHFFTALKFDLFCVASSKLSKVFLSGLPERHWPNGTTYYEVL